MTYLHLFLLLKNIKKFLTQYIESDKVDDNGKLINAELEIVPPPSYDQAPVMWLVIRLRERNAILTRIDPKVSRLVD